MTDLSALAAGVRAGDRSALARAITLVESSRPDDQRLAGDLLQELLSRTGGAIRVGISGVPGVGKSTFIEALGTKLTGKGHKVAVLAVDPSSAVSGGSILGDKTRMPALARDEAAFVRPSPGGRTLGGVARRTREALLLCEAAGHDVVIVETIGVGQSEVAVAGMVDVFVLLVLAGAGDELQGIKRGITEVADLLVVTKADGENGATAERARAAYAAALRLLPPPDGATGAARRVLACSALTRAGLPEVWRAVLDIHAARLESGRLEERRRRQAVHWMEQAVDDLLRERFEADPAVAAELASARQSVLDGSLDPMAAARRLIDVFVEGSDCS